MGATVTGTFYTLLPYLMNATFMIATTYVQRGKAFALRGYRI